MPGWKLVLLGLGGGFGSGFGLCCEFDPFENGALGGVALALVEANDTSVAAGAVFVGGGDLVEEHFDRVFLMQACGSEAAIVHGAALAKSDHFFGDGARGFGLGERCGDAFVFDEAADEVGEHRVAMGASATEFGGTFEVAHASEEV